MVLSEHRAAVKAFNERMAAAERGGYTWIEGYKSFQHGSTISLYRELYTTSASGHLKLRTDFSKMSEAELELQEHIMEMATERGTTKTEAQQIYEDVYGETPKDKVLKKWGEDIESIKEASLKRFYYKPGEGSEPGEVTAAVGAQVSKYEALAELLVLKKDKRFSQATGLIYEQAIDEVLKEKYIQ